jgi:hypothetical protein
MTHCLVFLDFCTKHYDLLDRDQPDGDQSDRDQPDRDQPDGDQPDRDLLEWDQPDWDQLDRDQPDDTDSGIMMLFKHLICSIMMDMY